jgi:hypothetical protein
MEKNVVEDQRILVLDVAFQNTLARWWANHKSVLRTWDEVKQTIKYMFQNKEQLESNIQTNLQVAQLFSGELNLRIHIEWCVTQWKDAGIPSHFWVQVFPHSLGPISKSWFIHEENRRQTSDWKTLIAHFFKDFSFTSKYPELEVVLQNIKEFVFTDNGNQKSNLVVCVKHNR